MLYDRVMSKFGEDFRPAVFRDVRGDQDKVQFAFTALQSVASDQQVARTQDEWEEAFYRFGRGDLFHRGSLACTRLREKTRDSRRFEVEGERVLSFTFDKSPLADFSRWTTEI